MEKVWQPTPLESEGIQNGRYQLITYEVQLQISYCVYTEISQESDVRKSAERRSRNTETFVHDRGNRTD